MDSRLAKDLSIIAVVTVLAIAIVVVVSVHRIAKFLSGGIAGGTDVPGSEKFGARRAKG